MSRAALPIVFRCGLPGNSRGWEGRVEVIRQGNNIVIRQIIWSRFRQFIWMCSQVQIAYWSG